MTSLINKSTVLNLYRNTLKVARIYGKVAEGKGMAAIEEIASFNRDVLKMQQITARNSLNRGVMTPALAHFAVRHLYRRGTQSSSEEQDLFIGDALSAYKKLNQKVAMLTQFPTVFEREHVVNGMKIEAKSRFVNMLRENGRYRYQVSIRFTNLSQETLQLLSESLATHDETLTQTTRECGLLSLQKKIPSPLKSLGVYEHVTTLSLPTPTGYCTFDYMFANARTGEIVRTPVPPLLLSTHDPDTAYRESCYRGDPQVDLQVVSARYQQEQQTQRDQEVCTAVQKQDEVMDMSSVDGKIMEADDDDYERRELETNRMELPKRATIGRLLDFQGEDDDDGSKQDDEVVEEEDDDDDEADQTGVHKPGQKAQPMA